MKVAFSTTSDDGSYLYINDQLIVDNGGTHGMETKSGSIDLKKGRQKLSCIYIQGGGGFGLELDMKELQGKSSAENNSTKIDSTFNVDDPKDIKKLRLKVNAKNAVAVYLNNELICRYAKKRKKTLFDWHWNDWEAVTLRPIALTLLKKGENKITVETKSNLLNTGKEKVGVMLEAFQK